MDSQSLLPNAYRLDNAQRFIDSIANDEYYFFVGNSQNPNTVYTPLDNPRDTLLNTYYNMVFGKKIQTNDVCLMVKRYEYAANTVYAMYNDRDPDLFNNPFYVMVQDGTQYDVFKCLDNAQNTASTVTPSRADVNESNDDFYYPNDGYRWKYMYSMSSDVVDQFGTPDYFPVTTDAGVKAQAVSGAIDVIAVSNTGAGYSNYLLGSFGVGDIRLNGNALVYGISTNGASTANGFYDGCWLYISSGPGAGQYRQIQSYTSNATYNSVTLESSFDASSPPQNTSTFEIYPSVIIRGDGHQTSAAYARAIINPTGNTVDHIEMLDRGAGYNTASASVLYSASVGVTTVASIQPIYSPTNGHGYDPFNELGAHYVGFGLQLSGNENGTILTDNDYAQWGIIRNPLFNNVTFSLTGLNQQFNSTETVCAISPKQLYGNFTSVKTANNILTNQISFTNDPSTYISVGDQLLLTYSNTYQVANVTTVSNTSVYLDANLSFDTANMYSANVYYPNFGANGFVSGYSTNSVTLTNCSSNFIINDTVIGLDSGTVGTISSFTITGMSKTFDTFLQTYSYTATITQGAFIEDEEVYQISNDIASAIFHSIVANTTTSSYQIYVTNQLGVFDTAVDGISLSDEIIGDTSGAIATLTNSIYPDLVFGSGDIVYLENFPPITRSSEKTETFQMVLNF